MGDPETDMNSNQQKSAGMSEIQREVNPWNLTLDMRGTVMCSLSDIVTMKILWTYPHMKEKTERQKIKDCTQSLEH